MKRLICEDKYGAEIFSFDFTGEFSIEKYNNCEISDVELDNGVTIIRLQQIEN